MASSLREQTEASKSHKHDATADVNAGSCVVRRCSCSAGGSRAAGSSDRGSHCGRACGSSCSLGGGLSAISRCGYAVLVATLLDTKDTSITRTVVIASQDNAVGIAETVVISL